MIIKSAALAAILALASSAGAQNHDQRLVLQPTSAWVADFKEESCAIRRAFSGEGQDVTLELDNFGLGLYFTVSLSSQTLTPIYNNPKFRFEPDDTFTDAKAPVITVYADGARGIIFSGATILRGEEFEATQKAHRAKDFGVGQSAEKLNERAQEITGLQIKGAFKRDIFLETGPLGKAMGVLRLCIDDLLTSKGLDPAVLRSLSLPPEPIKQRSWAWGMQNDYPRLLVKEEKTAKVDLRLLVDENGEVAECKTNPGGEDPVVADAACKSMFKYARFKAALDAEGNPTKGIFSTIVTYFSK